MYGGFLSSHFDVDQRSLRDAGVQSSNLHRRTSRVTDRVTNYSEYQLNRSSKILWGEGLMLRPQHFQRQDAYHEWRQAEMARGLHPYCWGLRHLKLDLDALLTGQLRVLELQGVLPDGDPFAAPQDDELPPSVSLSNVPVGTFELVFHLALAPMRPSGQNFSISEEEPQSAARFVSRSEPSGDWFTSAVEIGVPCLRRRLRLVSDLESNQHLVTMPLLRLRRKATGGFEMDPEFVPPTMSLSAAPHLQSVLCRLLGGLQAKVEALHGIQRVPSQHVIEFRSGDIASFWFLHTCNTAYAGLSHFHRHPLLHPERLFERMLELAGSLMSFSNLHSVANLPEYQHSEPGPAFSSLERIVTELLDTVISTRSFAIPVVETRPCFYEARLESERISNQTRFYIGVQASVPPSALVEAIPARLKVGTAEDVEKFVLSATPGVRLTYAPQVPSSIPVRPEHYYFLLDPHGPLYERMVRSGLVTLYAPNGLPDLRLELHALNTDK